MASAPSTGSSAGVVRMQGGRVVSSRCLRAAVFSGGPSSPAHFPRSPGPRGVPALSQVAGWGSQPPGRAELHQPGPRWRSGFGVRFSVSPTIVMLFLWIRTSHTLHLLTCWSQYLVSEVTGEVCPDTPHTPALGHTCRSEHAGRAAQERELL